MLQRVTLALLCCCLGCGHAQPVARSHPVFAPPPAHGVRLAVIPVDGNGVPEVADWVSSLLADVRIAGIDEYFKAKVTLEVVQLSIECVETSDACYTAVGKSLNANKILLAHVGTGSGKRKDKTVKITITLFDVDKGAAIANDEQLFKSKDDALANAEEMVAKAMAPYKDAPRTAQGTP